MRKFALAATALFALAGQAAAADLPSVKDAPVFAPLPSGWVFEATMNGFMPSLLVNTGFGNLPNTSANIGFFKLLDHIYGVAMGSFVARNDNFIAGVDLLWFRGGVNAHFDVAPGSPFGGVNAGLTLGQTILTGFGGARLPIGSPNFNLYAIAGVRYFSLAESLGLGAPVLGFARNFSLTKDWGEPIVGMAMRYKIDDKWFLDGEADIGGVNSSATWQAFGALGYNWTPSISSTLGFRALYTYDQQYNDFGGNFRIHQTLLGPQAAISYKF